MPNAVDVNISGVLGKIGQIFGNPARTLPENPEREKDRYFERFCILWEKLNGFLLIKRRYFRNTPKRGGKNQTCDSSCSFEAGGKKEKWHCRR